MSGAASPYNPHILSIFICWYEAGEQREDEIFSCYKESLSQKLCQCLIFPFLSMQTVAQGCQLLAACRKGGPLGTRQAFHLWMQRQTSCPIPYQFFLSCGLFLRREVSTAAQMLLQCCLLPTGVSLHLGPAICHPLVMKAKSLTGLPGAKLFTCSQLQRAVSGEKAVLGSLCRANVLPSWQLLGDQVSKSPAQAENTGTRLSAIVR